MLAGRSTQLMQASLSSTAVMQYRPLQSLECNLLLRRLLNVKDPLEYKGHLTLYVWSCFIYQLARLNIDVAYI